MPTTPLDADALMKVSYHAKGLDHLINFRVNLTEPYTIGTDPMITSFTGGAYDITSTNLMGHIVTQAKPMYLSSDHFNGWEVWDMQTNPPTFIFAGVDTTVGTHSGATSQRAEAGITVTFRDSLGKYFKHIWLATTDGDLGRHTGLSGGAVDTWINHMINGSPDDIGDAICGRSAHRVLAFKSYSIQTFDAIERKILYG